MTIRVNLRPLIALLALGLVMILFATRNRVGSAESEERGTNPLSEREYKRGLQYEGSGERVRRLLDKASRGEAITVSVVGGSVSKGRGLVPASLRNTTEDHEISRRRARAPTLYSPQNMHVLVFDWLSSLFPNKDHLFVNGAQGGVGAEYFGWCFKEHIPEEADLVIVELGINDLLDISGYAAYERLIRSILEMENRPAIINIETFTILFSPIISASAVHQDICAYYDIPSISLRDVVLPRILADPEEELPRWFRTGDELSLTDPKVREHNGAPVDMMHISALGHALAADLMIRYLSQQLHHLRQGWWRKQPVEEDIPVPSTLLTGAFEPLVKVPISTPVCRSMNSGNMHSDQDEEAVKGIPLAQGSSGWTNWSWGEKRYLTTKTPGAIAKFDFVTSKPSFPPPPRLPMQRPQRIVRPNRSRQGEEEQVYRGTVAIAYQRSRYYGLGQVSCWVDDEDVAMVLDGYWELEERNMGA